MFHPLIVANSLFCRASGAAAAVGPEATQGIRAGQPAEEPKGAHTQRARPPQMGPEGAVCEAWGIAWLSGRGDINIYIYIYI